MPSAPSASTRLACAALVLAAPLLAIAQPATPRADESLSPDLDTAIARALAYLARQQQADGSFQNRTETRRDNGQPEPPPQFSGPKVALTGLSLMAYLAAGRTPDAGKHGMVVRSGIDYVVKACPDDGYFGKVDGSRMYGHAIATLALAEVYGMEADDRQRQRVRPVLDRAVRVLLKAQQTPRAAPAHVGGWRYEIQSADSDLSVTGWCALALRAANNAGVDVPKPSADRAAEFILRCYDPARKGFAYQPGKDASVTMTGSAVLTLQLLDRGSLNEVEQGARYLLDHPVADDTEYPYYARYYATQAGFQLGGTRWPDIWKRTQSALLKSQQKDGAWPRSRTQDEPGQTYATALATLTVSIPLRLLPSYQR